MVAVPLIFGRLTADDYEDDVAADPRIDALRDRMEVRENKDFSRDYLDPDKRAIGNAVQVFFDDGTSTDRIAVDYPVGHRRRRAEGIPLLEEKFRRSIGTVFPPERTKEILRVCGDQDALERMPVADFVTLWVP
jgi:2-methylcitrate dehydratase